MAATIIVAADGTVQAQCVGDCSGDGAVTIDELVLAVDIVLGGAQVGDCSAADANQDGHVTVDEVVLAVNHAMLGCAGGSLSDLQIPDGFDYATSREVALDITVCTPNGNPFPGVAVMILAPPSDASLSTDVLWRGTTDTHGNFTSQVQVASRFTALRVAISAAGIVNDSVLPIADGQIVHKFGCQAAGTPG